MALRTAAEFASYFSASPRSPLVIRSVAEMHLARSGMDLYTASRASSSRVARVGFVPTMGALHAGHLGLVSAARAGCLRGKSAQLQPDFVVASIFVNPAQFAPHEDLSAYPRTWDADAAALEKARVDVIFAPRASSMYGASAVFRTFVSPVGADEATPEGAARPGFFRGVATVVTKLFSAVRPTDAWFGQKDGVQCIIIRSLARDLNLPTAIRIGQTAREPDGLAMSSRNVYLSPAQRSGAGVIYAALNEAVDMVSCSPEAAEAAAAAKARLTASAAAATDDVTAERLAQKASFAKSAPAAPLANQSPLLSQVARRLHDRILAEPAFQSVDYVAFSDALTGGPINSLGDSTARNGAVMLSVAARTGTTRLLDNIMLVGSHEDLGAAPGEEE
jgi:pantoate--beta-alanine ligase